MEFRTEFADYKDELAFLRAYLTEQGYLYYVLDAPVIPDYEYDRLNRRLEELEAEHPEEITPDSPTQRVGGKILDAFQPYAHEVPLESLQDVFNEGEVAAFCEKMEEALGPMAEYSVEPKVDGLSVALEYRDGVFVRGATRGDGRVGEDVTENLRTVRSIPMTLPEKLPRLIVRGEVYMARSVFESINAKRELEGKPLMANPRNAAAGSLRQLDSKICAQRQLDIAVFNLQLAEGREFTSHAETLDYLASQRFKVIPHKTLRGTSEIQTEIFRINDERMDYPFDIDGAVVKVNSLSDRTILGSTAKFPKWAVAYKYPPEKKYATVTDIVVQVGRTGVLTPKAVLTPVRLAGTTVTSATLHNQDFITEKDIRIGDTVLVQKAGEIIPEILSVDLTKRPEGTKPYTLPEVCPVCGAPVVRDEDGAALRCTGAECPAQLQRNITHFASRDAMDIEGLGPAVVAQLVDYYYQGDLLEAVAQVLKVIEGAYALGIVCADEPDKIVAMGIAHTPEGRMVFPDLTVETNLLAGAYTRGDRAGIREDIQKYYEKFPILGERKNQKAGLMSGGEQQMLAIARSLMSRPKLLMLDEPSLGLAPVVVDDVYRIIKDIAADGMTILLVEQNATRALNVADRAYILANGEIEMSGTAKELAENDDVRKAYLGV